MKTALVLAFLTLQPFIELCGLGPIALADQIGIRMTKPRGGFGDVASNLLMVEQLRKLRPENDYTVVFAPEVAPILSVILPPFDAALRSQKISGIQFLAQGEVLPPFDLYAGFSERDGGEAQTRVHLSAMEYGEVQDSVLAKTWGEYGERTYQFIYGNEKTSYLSYFKTGVKTGGLYISQEAPPPIDRSSVLEGELRARGVLLEEEFRGNSVEIGFSYTSNPEVSLHYIEAVRNLAVKHPEKRYLVFSGGGTDFTGEIPQNFKLVPSGQTSIAHQSHLIQISTLPVMITGDASLTLALEHEKAFLYEVNWWKEIHIGQWFNFLKKELGFERDHKTRDLVFSVLNLDAKDPNLADVQLIEKFLENTDLAKRWSEAIKKNRANWSMAKRVFAAYDLLKSAPKNEILDFLTFKPLFQRVLLEGSQPDWLAVLKDSNETLETRIAVFKFLAVSTLRSDEESQALAELLMNDSEREFSIRALRLIRDALERSEYAAFKSSLLDLVMRSEKKDAICDHLLKHASPYTAGVIRAHGKTPEALPPSDAK